MILIPKYQNMIQLNGSLSLVLTDESGKIKQEMYVPNTVVTTGKQHIASCLGNPSAQTRMAHMAIGISDAAATTALASEVVIAAPGVTAYNRINMASAANSSITIDTSGSNSSVTYIAQFGPNNPTSTSGQALKEAGIFNSGSSGTMLCRTTFGTVTKLTADTLTINWTIAIN